MMAYQAVVIGCSAGGVSALQSIFQSISHNFPVPIIVVAHQIANSRSMLADVLNYTCAIEVIEAEEKVMPQANHIYTAPANYHLLIEHDGSFSLNVDPKVCFCRPAIDVTFETASEYYGKKLIAVLLTGANSDGSNGVRAVKQAGGIAIVQDPLSAEVATMPESAIRTGCVDYVLPTKDILGKLLKLIEQVSE